MAEEQNKQDPWEGIIARSGHFKDYYFQPGVITGVGDGTNQGLVRFTVQIGQQSSGDDDENGKWAYPFIMPNHAAYSTPVVGSKIWVMTNETNPDEIFYWLMPELHPSAQGAVDGADGNTDIISNRQMGLGSSSLVSTPDGGYTISSTNGYGNFGGGSNEQRDSQGAGYKTKGGKTIVGAADHGAEAMVLGQQLKTFLEVYTYAETLAWDLAATFDPPLEPVNLFWQKAMAIIAVKLGMEEMLSDNSLVADDIEAYKNEEIDNMTDEEIDAATAQMLNDLGYEGRTNWTASEAGQMLNADWSSGIAIREALKEHNHNKITGAYNGESGAVMIGAMSNSLSWVRSMQTNAGLDEETREKLYQSGQTTHREGWASVVSDYGEPARQFRAQLSQATAEAKQADVQAKGEQLYNYYQTHDMTGNRIYNGLQYATNKWNPFEYYAPRQSVLQLSPADAQRLQTESQTRVSLVAQAPPAYPSVPVAVSDNTAVRNNYDVNYLQYATPVNYDNSNDDVSRRQAESRMAAGTSILSAL